MPVLDLPSWAPQVSDVAIHTLARTRLPNGTLAGTFNSQTTPTDTQVSLLIQKAVRLLAPRLGDVPDALADSAQVLAELRAAMMVERSYFAEQVGDSMSPYNDLAAEYKEALRNWDMAATGQQPGATHLASLAVGTLYPGYATGTY